jgi:hypothetical protein
MTNAILGAESASRKMCAAESLSRRTMQGIDRTAGMRCEVKEEAVVRQEPLKGPLKIGERFEIAKET